MAVMYGTRPLAAPSMSERQSRSLAREIRYQTRRMRLHASLNAQARRLYEGRQLDLDRRASDVPSAFLAAVVMIRGEDDYLHEWLEFNLMMGVEHFFVYHNDNGTEPETKALLQPYIDDRVVTYVPWPDIEGTRRHWTDLGRVSTQQLAYGHCTMSYGDRFDWLLKIDVDEFAFPTSRERSSVADVLRSLDGRDVMSIVANRTEYGSNGHTSKPPGLVIESYTRRANRYFDADVDTKAVARSRYLSRDWYSTAFDFRCRVVPKICEKLAGTPRTIAGPAANELLTINHYQTKSLEEYRRKYRLNLSGYYAGRETDEKFWELDRRANDVESFEILRFAEDLRSRLCRAALPR